MLCAQHNISIMLRCKGRSLDFSKAFNIVNHHLLLNKPEARAISSLLCKWVVAFLRAWAGGQLSSQLQLSSTVPQGPVRGPLLFPIFTNELPVSIISRCDMLVNDVKLICSTSETNTILEYVMQTFLWTSVRDMRINAVKSQNLHLDPENVPSLIMLDDMGTYYRSHKPNPCTDVGVIAYS